MTFVNPIEFFGNPDINIGLRILEVVFLIMGLICIYAGVKNLRDKENPSPFGTAVFWCALGVVLALGRYLPSLISGILVLIMGVPAIINRVKKGKIDTPSNEETGKAFNKIGMKILIPTLSFGVFAILFAVLFSADSALPTVTQAPLIGIAVGVLLSMILLRAFNKENKPKVFIKDSERFLSVVGPLCMLPMLLASLGAVFTAAEVGPVISQIFGNFIPDGNLIAGIIVYCIAMAVFTMIMGNAFAAITVITIGIGAPFVLIHDVNPVIIGALALTSGYCGTLMTPMAANFNIVPVALLDMKSKFGVIKQQFYIAIPMLIFQIFFMILFA
jgi:uncharacterized membrane protein